MCCIFTCFAWVIDVVQRFWTFTMSCCISSAICCTLATASMSGVAMGYNYSLAEYIDLKETNVSVYLKRGVFDDEISDDMEFRRSGRQPVAGHIADNDLVSAEPEQMPLQSARRLDDSLLQSDDNKNFEGSLMKLTAVPPAHTAPKYMLSEDNRLKESLEKFTTGSLDQIKDIQGVLNMRRMNQRRTNTINMDFTFTTSTERLGIGFRRLNPAFLNKAKEPSTKPSLAVLNDLYKVPDTNQISHYDWFLANKKVPDELKGGKVPPLYDDDYVGTFTIPPPIRYKPGYSRPTVKTVRPSKKIAGDIQRSREQETVVLEDQPDYRRRGKVTVDYNTSRKETKPRGYQEPKSEEVEYEDDALKGIPRRNRRYVLQNNVTDVVNNYVSDGTSVLIRKLIDQFNNGTNSKKNEVNYDNVFEEIVNVHSANRDLHEITSEHNSSKILEPNTTKISLHNTYEVKMPSSLKDTTKKLVEIMKFVSSH